MNLYLVRHGETEWNRLRKFQGQQNSELTEIGIEQAKALGEYLKKAKIEFDYVYSSPLLRAYHTAQLITDLDIIKDDRIMEMDFGKWEGMDLDFIKKDALENFENFFYKTEEYTHEPHEAESFEKLENRVKSFLDEIKEKHKSENILVVSHGVALKVFIKVIKKQSLKEFSESGGLFNTSLSLITYNDKWNVEYLSKLDHLDKDLVTEWIAK